jgi:hypothetical protein
MPIFFGANDLPRVQLQNDVIKYLKFSKIRLKLKYPKQDLPDQIKFDLKSDLNLGQDF